MIKQLTTLSTLVLLLNGCALNAVPKQPVSVSSLATAYDYQLLDPEYRLISLVQMTATASKADVVFIGEYHGNHASHLLQAELLAALHKQQTQSAKKRPMILSMEQFERDQQEILDLYLDNKIGERQLITKAPTWPNYKGSYRPLVEYAKQHKMPVIAANAPGDIVRCIGKQGSKYLEKLPTKQRHLLATQPFVEVDGYSDKFFGAMGLTGHVKTTGRLYQSYQAQLARDNTMAESILKALKASPNAQVLHLNGSFHSADHLGTVGALKRLDPALKIVVITPVHTNQLAEHKKKHQVKNDYFYLLNLQPKDFVSAENMKAAHKAMFAKSAQKAKFCE